MEDFFLWLDNLNMSSDDPLFAEQVFLSIAKKLKSKDGRDDVNYKRIVAEEYGDLSRRLDRSRFQESSSVRNVLKTRRLAQLLINEEGELDQLLLPELIKYLKQHCYSLGPRRQHDGPRHEYMLKILERLHIDAALQRQLKMISKPYAHKVGDQIIRDTLQLPQHHVVTDAHARRAALAALLCYLRQNVGSCFATAPAIVVQGEQPEIFLKDINALFGAGRLQRVFGGIEYAAPLSLTWGAGDLRKIITLDRHDQEAIEDLGNSPGLLYALELVGVIDKTRPLKERIEILKKQIIDFIKKTESTTAHFLQISAEEILRALLMGHFQITEKDLYDYENRPRAMLHTSLMMTHSPSMGGKGEVCAHFLIQFAFAKNAFKSLADNALLKSWEFTLASFAETKPAFTRWNMYASLGFNAEDKGGIGAILYETISDKLNNANAKVHELQLDYEQAYNQLKYMEARMRAVSTEKEAHWLRVEYESKRNEFNNLEEIRNRENFKAKRFANLFSDLLEAYDNLFPRYFQEVYDADMHEITSGPYDDSPAGFRLLYKHGRTNTSQWTLIYTPQEFIDALSAFFVATETELVNNPQFEGLQQEIVEIVTQLVTTIKTDEFLESAFYRMARAHNTPFVKNPLEHLDKIDKKPWAYTSGGTMHNLMSCYFKLPAAPVEQQRWVENEMELLVYLIDTIKQMPHKISEEYIQSVDRALLMHSPTHAFTLKPSFPLFKEAVVNESYSFTWVRDHLVRIPERFIEYHFLDDEMMRFLIDRLKEMVPANFKHRFQTIFATINGKKNAREFRQLLLDEMESDRGLQIGREIVLSSDQIDSALYGWLPLFSYRELKNRSEKILENVPGINGVHHAAISDCLDQIINHWGSSSLVTARQLQEICKTTLCLVLQATSASYDYPLLISQQAQKLGYALPTPVIFADTNWAKEYFAFLVSPGTARLELWRVDYTGSEGAPMSMWKEWLDGSRRDKTWGVFTKPAEYRI